MKGWFTTKESKRSSTNDLSSWIRLPRSLGFFFLGGVFFFLFCVGGWEQYYPEVWLGIISVEGAPSSQPLVVSKGYQMFSESSAHEEEPSQERPLLPRSDISEGSILYIWNVYICWYNGWYTDTEVSQIVVDMKFKIIALIQLFHLALIYRYLFLTHLNRLTLKSNPCFTALKNSRLEPTNHPTEIIEKAHHLKQSFIVRGCQTSRFSTGFVTWHFNNNDTTPVSRKSRGASALPSFNIPTMRTQLSGVQHWLIDPNRWEVLRRPIRCRMYLGQKLTNKNR